MKVNPVYVPDGAEHRKKFCKICSEYYRWINTDIHGLRYLCPLCGRDATADDLLSEQDGVIIGAHISKPLIAHKKKDEEEEHDPDLPAHISQWETDTES